MTTDTTADLTAAPILEREPKALTPHLEGNSAMVAATIQHGHESLFARLFPGEAERALRTHELDQLKTGFEYRQRALRMAVETKLQAVEELCNQVLVTGKGEIRRKRQEFFAEQKLQLQQSMNACTERFHVEMERRFDALEALRNAHIRAREEQRLERAVDEFHDMLEQLGADFLAIIHEGVSSRG
ncbi:MAG TPA: hypothetical protein VES73_06775 [Lamprocystis sp. (in: g-proteobacteria)]|nr:hypothetical protein [Lamprocystis sp. (in: g-proteobacteria)]